MKCTAKEVLQYVEENDVKFVKLTFCDLFGRQKNVSVVSQQLPSIFENGYLFNSTAVSGFENCAGDLLLFPDPKTLSVLPWRPRTGEVISMLAYIKRPDGSFYESDTLHLLDVAKTKLVKHGLQCEIATDCEFYVFKQDGNGDPTDIPIDRGGYLDSAPEDAGENVRRDIILSLEDMGIVPIASHHEQGHGQNEIDFKPTEPGGAARNLLFFKSAVKNVCRASGMYATFDPKPLDTQPGSGLRIGLTLSGTGENKDKLTRFARGVLQKASCLLPFFNTTPQSFGLLEEKRAPVRDYKNPDRGACICAFALSDDKYRIEVNAADCLCNQFLAFALLIEAGLFGIDNECESEHMAYPVHGNALPHSFDDALRVAQQSDWLRKVLGADILDAYVRGKRADENPFNE